MKLWLLIVLGLSLCGSALAQSDARISRAEAIRQFPDLARAGSDFNETFVKAVNLMKQERSPLLSTDEWPLHVAYNVGATLAIPPAGAVSLREIATDIPSYIGKTVTVAGTIEVSDYFNYGYSSAGNSLYSFRIEDETKQGNLYGLREATAPLRQKLLSMKAHSFFGIFVIRLSEQREHTAGEGVLADLVKVLAIQPKAKAE